MIAMIDNYDSFTYNLVQYLGELGAEVRVWRNDEISVDALAGLAPERIVLSPGPCTPNEAGISVPLIQRFAGKLSILGVCLGHQSIGQAFGGKIVHAGQLMHGKTSDIRHKDAGVFNGLPNPLTATRYHSLVIEKK
ncbi:MAG: aminodeoxychorismate/anthranilate synthase component II, partial [Pseudomonadota bacterium]